MRCGDDSVRQPRWLLVTAGRGVLVVSHRRQLRAEQLLSGDQLKSAGVLHELVRHQEGDVVVLDAFVRRGVLPFEVGVDRHLFNAASTNGADVVDGGRPAFGTDDVQCLVAGCDFHNEIILNPGRSRRNRPTGTDEEVFGGRGRGRGVPQATWMRATPRSY